MSRQGGNANRAWDIDYLMWDSHGNHDVVGRLATDRPHVAKLYGAYQTPFGTQVGAFFYGGSGTPLRAYVITTDQIPVIVNGRNDLGRTRCFRAPTSACRTSSTWLGIGSFISS